MGHEEHGPVHGHAADLIPQDVKHLVDFSRRLGSDDIAVLKAIKEAIPNADRMSAEQVLQHVLDAVRTSSARLSWLCRAQKKTPVNQIKES